MSNFISITSSLTAKIAASMLLAASIITVAPLNNANAAAHLVAQNEPNIEVSGSGKSSIAPDMAIINLGVQREATTAREALDANNGAMQRVLSELKKSGIEDRDLQTSNFNIQPRYFYPPRKTNGEQKPPKITGYTVSNNLTVRVRKLADLGVILDKVVTLGVNAGGGINFTNSDPAKTIQQARENAMQDAISKANTLTNAAGVKLGKVLKISETSSAPRPVAISHARAAFKESADAAVPVAAGENSFRVHVNVKWALEQ